MTQEDFDKVLLHIKRKLELDTAATPRADLKAYLLGYIDGVLGSVEYEEKKK